MPAQRFEPAPIDAATRAVTLLTLGLILAVPAVVGLLAGGPAMSPVDRTTMASVLKKALR